MGSSDILSKMLSGTGVRMEYESKLFDTDEIISIDIRMDEDKWNKMLKNATSEEYYVCDAVVNGKTFKSVAIRPKGNTSLSAIAMDPDSERFSLKLEFDHFVDGQTCFGLDKLILNNNYADATNMKEAVIYDMYKYIGADASLYNYASVSLNGEYWGVYLALEGVEESFFLRNYGTQDGELYKPDSMEMGGGAGTGPSKEGSDEENPSERKSPSDRPGGADQKNKPEGFDKGNMPEGFDKGNMPDMSNTNKENLPNMNNNPFGISNDDRKTLRLIRPKMANPAANQEDQDETCLHFQVCREDNRSVNRVRQI